MWVKTLCKNFTPPSPQEWGCIFEGGVLTSQYGITTGICLYMNQDISNSDTIVGFFFTKFVCKVGKAISIMLASRYICIL